MSEKQNLKTPQTNIFPQLRDDVADIRNNNGNDNSIIDDDDDNDNDNTDDNNADDKKEIQRLRR